MEPEPVGTRLRILGHRDHERVDCWQALPPLPSQLVRAGPLPFREMLLSSPIIASVLFARQLR